MSLGKIIGYIRVSSYNQNVDRQLEGIKTDKIFIDKVSGKSIDRPQLQALINYVRDGDTVIVHSLDRLARNLDDLRKLVNNFNERDVKVQFVKENLLFTGQDSGISTLLLSVMGAFAEFERALIHERQMEGIIIAKQKGAFKGRKKVLSQSQLEEIKHKLSNLEKKSHLSRLYNIHRTTLDRYLKEALLPKRIE